MYVIFQKDTGKVLGISSKSAAENSIPVDLDKVLGILKGTDSKKNYRVEYNAKQKQLELIDLHQENFDGSSVNDFIYEIPEDIIEDADITIEQDIPNTCWKIMLGKSLKRNLKLKGVRLNSILKFSITAKHDPNILFKTLAVDFSQVFNKSSVILPFDSDFEFLDLPLSIFTARKFDSYQFKRIFDDR